MTAGERTACCLPAACAAPVLRREERAYSRGAGCDEGNGLRPREDSPGIGAGFFIVAAVTGHLDVRTGADGAEIRMSFPVPLTTANQQHANAVERLDAALVEQDQMGERFDAAVGTSTELGAYVRLQAAGEQVTAREAWVTWVDDESYRDLNAGPFELRAEAKTATGAQRHRTQTAAARPRREAHDRARRTIKARHAVSAQARSGRPRLAERSRGRRDRRPLHPPRAFIRLVARGGARGTHANVDTSCSGLTLTLDPAVGHVANGGRCAAGGTAGPREPRGIA